MNKVNELTTENEHQHKPITETSFSVRFLESNEISTQEVDLLMSVLEEILAEMQRLELASPSLASPLVENEGRVVQASNDEHDLLCSLDLLQRTGT